MKRLLCIGLLALLFSRTFSQNGQMFTDKIDARFGFRDIKLESDLNQLKSKQLLKIEDDGPKKYYKSKVEDLKLGDYHLKSVTYGFYKGQLMTINIETKGLSNSTGLLNILRESYGNGFKGNEYLEQYLWKSEKVSILYDQNPVTNNAVVSITSTKLEDLSSAEEGEKDKKASKQAF